MTGVGTALEAAPKIYCTNTKHMALAADTDHEHWPDCGRPLAHMRPPAWKCQHGAMRMGCPFCNHDRSHPERTAILIFAAISDDAPHLLRTRLLIRPLPAS
jgi:hypothetical protein